MKSSTDDEDEETEPRIDSTSTPQKRPHETESVPETPSSRTDSQTVSSASPAVKKPRHGPVNSSTDVPSKSLRPERHTPAVSVPRQTSSVSHSDPSINNHRPGVSPPQSTPPRESPEPSIQFTPTPPRLPLPKPQIQFTRTPPPLPLPKPLPSIPLPSRAHLLGRAPAGPETLEAFLKSAMGMDLSEYHDLLLFQGFSLPALKIMATWDRDALQETLGRLLVDGEKALRGKKGLSALQIVSLEFSIRSLGKSK
ncbi:hypothetical protein B0H10DRAFT_770526 [Mycena sp. CBHHK59/15]|nr:hypothetical protein B0H10DRAFT_770526 [Mycena sp. CBHHK59/15]